VRMRIERAAQFPVSSPTVPPNRRDWWMHIVGRTTPKALEDAVHSVLALVETL